MEQDQVQRLIAGVEAINAEREAAVAGMTADINARTEALTALQELRRPTVILSEATTTLGRVNMTAAGGIEMTHSGLGAELLLVRDYVPKMTGSSADAEGLGSKINVVNNALEKLKSYVRQGPIAVLTEDPSGVRKFLVDGATDGPMKDPTLTATTDTPGRYSYHLTDESTGRKLFIGSGGAVYGFMPSELMERLVMDEQEQPSQARATYVVGQTNIENVLRTLSDVDGLYDPVTVAFLADQSGVSTEDLIEVIGIESYWKIRSSLGVAAAHLIMHSEILYVGDQTDTSEPLPPNESIKVPLERDLFSKLAKTFHAAIEAIRQKLPEPGKDFMQAVVEMIEFKRLAKPNQFKLLGLDDEQILDIGANMVQAAMREQPARLMFGLHSVGFELQPLAEEMPEIDLRKININYPKLGLTANNSRRSFR